MHTNLRYTLLLILVGATTVSYAQRPVVSYSSPQTYFTGVAITPLVPASSGVAAPTGLNTQVTIGSGFNNLRGVAVDHAGNVYVAEDGDNDIKKIPAAGGTPVTVGSGFLSPTGVAVDAAGNVYVADNGNNAIKKVPVGGGAIVTIGSGFNGPYGVAVDAAGNVYVGDANNNAVKEILAGGNTTISLGTGFSHPTGVAVDAAGNVYVANRGNSKVQEILAVGGATITLGNGFGNTNGVAVDSFGNVYWADTGTEWIWEIPVGGGLLVRAASGLSAPLAVAIGATDLLYIGDNGTESAIEVEPAGGYTITPALPAGLSLNNTTGTISGTPTAVSPATNYIVVAYNSSGGTPVTVNIQVVGALLSSLSLNPAAPLTQVAGPDYKDYTATVANTVSSISVTPTAQVAGVTTITVNGTAVTSGTASASIPLATGANTITIVATAQGGSPSQTSVVTVGRGASNALLSHLAISSGTLTAVPGTNNFTAAEGNATTSVTVTPTTNDPAATVTVAVNGGAAVPVTSGTASGSLPLNVGANTIAVVVTAQDGVTIQTYNIIAGRGASNPLLSHIALTPASALTNTGTVGGTTTFTTSVNNATSSVTVTPTAQDANATMKVDGTTVTSGTASGSIALAEGANTTINTVVTAQDGVTTHTYSIVVTRAKSSNALLSSIRLTPTSTLTNTGTTGSTTTYTTTAANGTTSVTVTPTAQDANATIKVNGAAVASGTASTSIALASGTTTTINTVVTAQDGTTTHTYSIVVTRLSNNALLNAIELTPASALTNTGTTGSTTTYTTTAAGATTSVTVTPTAQDANAKIKVNGTAVASGTASGSIALAAGTTTTINTVVTAQDGTTTHTYSIAVTRPISVPVIAYTTPDVFIVGAPIAPLAPVNSGGTPTSYSITGTLPPGLTFNTLTGLISGTPTVVAAAANYTVSATNTGGTGSTVLNITVNNTLSNNALLSSIKLTPASILTNTGTSGSTTTYTTAAAGATTSVTVTPTAQDAFAIIKVNGVAVTSGTASASIALAAGTSTTINTVVTSQDGTTTHTYSIIITGLSNNALLSSVKLTPTSTLTNTGTVGTTTTFTTSVSNATASVTVTATAQDATATIKVNGVTVASGTASGSIALAVGNNTINTVVTAEDGTTTHTYSIIVTRPKPADDALSNLTISSGSIPNFERGLTSYSTTVTNATTSVTLTPTFSDPLATATLAINGGSAVPVTSGAASASLPLNVGANTIIIVVTAQDGTTTRTYTITVNRFASNVALLSQITISSGALVAVSGTNNFTVSESNATTAVTVTPTVYDPATTVTISLNGGAAVPVTSGTASGSLALNVGTNTIALVVTAENGTTTNIYNITATRASGPLMSLYQPISVTKPADNLTIENDGVMVHQGVSPNGDGINDVLTIDGLAAYQDNRLTIIDRNGSLIYQAKGYDNGSKAFDGHSNINGKLLQSGTYFYSLDYSINGQGKHKTGYILLKY